MSVKIEHRLGLPVPPPLSRDLALPGQSVRVIKPVILDWVPNEQIHWRLSLAGGLVKTTRYLEIEILTERGCIFANGELFDGPLGPLAARRMGASIRAGFKAMGEAVKERVMATWRPDGG